MEWRACNPEIGDTHNPFSALAIHISGSPLGDGVVFALSSWNLSAIAMFARSMYRLFAFVAVPAFAKGFDAEPKSVISIRVINKNRFFLVSWTGGHALSTLVICTAPSVFSRPDGAVIDKVCIPEKRIECARSAHEDSSIYIYMYI